MPWPRLYSLTLPQLRALPQAEQDEIWREYREFWHPEGPPMSRGHDDTFFDDPKLQREYQKDFTEDQNGDFR